MPYGKENAQQHEPPHLHLFAQERRSGAVANGAQQRFVAAHGDGKRVPLATNFRTALKITLAKSSLKQDSSYAFLGTIHVCGRRETNRCHTFGASQCGR